MQFLNEGCLLFEEWFLFEEINYVYVADIYTCTVQLRVVLFLIIIRMMKCIVCSIGIQATHSVSVQLFPMYLSFSRWTRQ